MKNSEYIYIYLNIKKHEASISVRDSAFRTAFCLDVAILLRSNGGASLNRRWKIQGYGITVYCVGNCRGNSRNSSMQQQATGAAAASSSFSSHSCSSTWACTCMGKCEGNSRDSSWQQQATGQQQPATVTAVTFAAALLHSRALGIGHLAWSRSWHRAISSLASGYYALCCGWDLACRRIGCRCQFDMPGYATTWYDLRLSGTGPLSTDGNLHRAMGPFIANIGFHIGANITQ